jgi:hypothetical protein
MRGRRQIVDPLTGARLPASSPFAVDTGAVVVGRGVVVPRNELEPSDDRLGIQPGAQARLKQEIDDAKRRPKVKHARALPATFTTPAAALAEFEDQNPHIFGADGFDDVDIADAARDYMDRIEVRRGKGHIKLNKSPIGVKILAARSGSAVVRGLLRYLFSRAAGKRWRAVPWSDVEGFAGVVADALGVTKPSLPIVAGQDPPDVALARARAELGPREAATFARSLRADELRTLADRLERALEHADECLSGQQVAGVRQRLRAIRRWVRQPDEVPDWACVGSEETEGTSCALPGLLEDVKRIEAACRVDYDPQWPARGPKAGRIQNPAAPTIAQLGGTLSEHGRVVELRVELADGRIESHTWRSGEPLLLWSPKARALVFVHGARVPRATRGNVPRDDGAAATWERFHGKQATGVRELEIPSARLAELGRGLIVAYRGPRWGGRVAEHKLGRNVRVWSGSVDARRVYVLTGGSLRMTARGIEG